MSIKGVWGLTQTAASSLTAPVPVSGKKRNPSHLSSREARLRIPWELLEQVYVTGELRMVDMALVAGCSATCVNYQAQNRGWKAKRDAYRERTRAALEAMRKPDAEAARLAKSLEAMQEAQHHGATLVQSTIAILAADLQDYWERRQQWKREHPDEPYDGPACPHKMKDVQSLTKALLNSTMWENLKRGQPTAIVKMGVGIVDMVELLHTVGG